VYRNCSDPRCAGCNQLDSQCVVCNVGYANVGGVCGCADSNCLDCVIIGDSQQCALCQSGYVLSNGVCEKIVEEETLDPMLASEMPASQGIRVNCGISCVECDQNGCTNCKGGWLLIEGRCDVILP